MRSGFASSLLEGSGYWHGGCQLLGLAREFVQQENGLRSSPCPRPLPYGVSAFTGRFPVSCTSGRCCRWRYLVDGREEGCVSKILELRVCLQSISDAVVGHYHRFLETGVNQVQLVRAAYDDGLFPFGELFPRSQLDRAKQALLDGLLVTLSHAAETYVR